MNLKSSSTAEMARFVTKIATDETRIHREIEDIEGKTSEGILAAISFLSFLMWEN
jgi:hypothetical protein